MIQVDHSGWNELSADISRAVERMPGNVRKAVTVSSHKVRDDARERISGLAHAPHYPRSITYDIVDTPLGVAGEIGPDKDLMQGALGVLFEFGSVHNPPHPHLGPALVKVEDDFVHGLGMAVEL